MNHLRNWREAVEAISRALGDLEVEAEVYVVGGG